MCNKLLGLEFLADNFFAEEILLWLAEQVI